jgi:ubiquitin-conjugating enzyme E2 S
MIFNELDNTDVQAEIEGPVGTPYEGGVFRCKLAVEHDFPNNPPKGT